MNSEPADFTYEQAQTFIGCSRHPACRHHCIANLSTYDRYNFVPLGFGWKMASATPAIF